MESSIGERREPFSPVRNFIPGGRKQRKSMVPPYDSAGNTIVKTPNKRRGNNIVIHIALLTENRAKENSWISAEIIAAPAKQRVNSAAKPIGSSSTGRHRVSRSRRATLSTQNERKQPPAYDDRRRHSAVADNRFASPERTAGMGVVGSRKYTESPSRRVSTNAQHYNQRGNNFMSPERVNSANTSAKKAKSGVKSSPVTMEEGKEGSGMTVIKPFVLATEKRGRIHKKNFEEKRQEIMRQLDELPNSFVAQEIMPKVHKMLEKAKEERTGKMTDEQFEEELRQRISNYNIAAAQELDFDGDVEQHLPEELMFLSDFGDSS
eukprot:jgi/Bigna1/145379/aug1.98_g20087